MAIVGVYALLVAIFMMDATHTRDSLGLFAKLPKFPQITGDSLEARFWVLPGPYRYFCNDKEASGHRCSKIDLIDFRALVTLNYGAKIPINYRARSHIVELELNQIRNE